MRVSSQPLSVILLFLITAGTQAQTNPPTAVLSSVHVSGAARFKEAQVVSASGLQTGIPFDPAKLDEATQKLGKSGAFEEVQYRYKPDKDGIAAELIVKESQRFHRCIFDNFVWLKQSEIADYLRQHVPLFDGAAPESGDLPDDISAALQMLLKEHNVILQVTRTQYGALGDRNWQHLYFASGVAMKITSVRFFGRQAIDEGSLLHEAKPLIGRDYSLHDCLIFGRATFAPYYRERGYLRINLNDPTTEITRHVEGSNAYEIQVTYPLQEGLLYSWNGAQWTFNQAISSGDLDGILGMKFGESANGVKLEEGLEKIEKEYNKHGYIALKLKPELSFDDAAKKVTYHVQVSEGGQFKMGTLMIEAPADKVADRLKSKWRLKPGDVFDQSYFDDFLKKDLPAIAFPPGKSAKFGFRITPHPEQLTADVLIQIQGN